MRCPECDAVNPPEAVRCKACGEKLRRPARPADEEDEDTTERVQAKPRRREPEGDDTIARRRRPAPRDEDEDEERPRRRRREEEDEDDEDEESIAATIVPYKNPMALISYYLGYVGLAVGLGAIVWMVALFQSAEQAKGAKQETIDSMQLILKVGLGAGAFLGLVGFGLGIYGFLYGGSHRKAKGQAHATTGIVLGVINVIGQIVALILILLWIKNQFPQ